MVGQEGSGGSGGVGVGIGWPVHLPSLVLKKDLLKLYCQPTTESSSDLLYQLIFLTLCFWSHFQQLKKVMNMESPFVTNTHRIMGNKNLDQTYSISLQRFVFHFSFLYNSELMCESIIYLLYYQKCLKILLAYNKHNFK